MGLHIAYGQERSDSVSYEHALHRSKTYLSDTLSAGLNLYNGIEHQGYFRGIKGFAYLDSEQMTVGRVQYDGVWYTLPMLYDLNAEKVVIDHFHKFHRMSLINEKISAFVLHNHVFRNLPVQEPGKRGPSGLCEVLYEGDSVALFAKKRKLLNERSTAHGLEREFVVNNQYYMKIDNEFHHVRSKRDMYTLMGDKRKDVVSQLRRKKLKFKKNKEEALILASGIYDENS